MPQVRDSPHQDFTWNHLLATMRLGIKSLWLHRLRSLLTVLGIVFGVCSVIAMLAIGEGASFEAQEQIRQLGSQNILLKSIKPTEDEKVSQNEGSWVIDYGLNYQDLKRIRETIPGVETIVPARKGTEYVFHGTRRLDCEIFGTLPNYRITRNKDLKSGRFFTDRELDDYKRVCVLEEHTAEMLFPLKDFLGNDIRIGGKYYRVIGIIQGEKSGKDSLKSGPSTSAKHRVYIPLTSFGTQFGEIIVKYRTGTMESEKVALHEATVQVAKLEHVMEVGAALKTLLSSHHRKEDYEIVIPLELLARAQRTQQIFSLVLGSIAAISLIVGGIGIMNIMLASVTERTREIGIRRALGARRNSIIAQFLIETVMLSAGGGLVGVSLGMFIPFLVGHFAEMKTIVTWWSPLLAFGISALVGVAFGIYPALRAARMDPVDALRHE